MNKTTTFFIGLLTATSLAFSVVALFSPIPTPAQPIQSKAPTFGAAGSEFGEQVHLFNNAIIGGYVLATSSTAATYTITAQELSKAPTVISWTPNVNLTISLSATSTRSYVPNVGDTATLYFRNASTTAASAITFAAADAGVDLQFAEATGGDLVLNGLDWEKVTLIRNALNGASQVTVILDEMTEAD